MVVARPVARNVARAPATTVAGMGDGAASLSYDFLAGVLPSTITFIRSTSGTYFNSIGLLQTASTNIARFDYNPTTLTPRGLLIEETRTNIVLWNRDLTNGAWTPADITPAKDQVGIDGVTNSASKITATAGNGTILQTVTLASSARYQSAYIKRITGSGNIDMTTDNGATWTTVTATSTWTRVEIPTQTLANPILGFRIVTSGDAIAVDYVQNETGTFATSPIATTTAATTRGLDIATVGALTPWFNATAGTLWAQAMPYGIGATASARAIHGFDDTTTNERIQNRILSPGTSLNGVMVDGGVVQFSGGGGTTAAFTSFKVATRYQLNDVALAGNGAVLATDATATIPTVTRMTIGSGPGCSEFCGAIAALAYYPVGLSNSILQSLTS